MEGFGRLWLEGAIFRGGRGDCVPTKIELKHRSRSVKCNSDWFFIRTTLFFRPVQSSYNLIRIRDLLTCLVIGFQKLWRLQKVAVGIQHPAHGKVGEEMPFAHVPEFGCRVFHIS